MPTVLDVLSIPPPSGVQGKSMLPLAMMVPGVTSLDSSSEAYSELLGSWRLGRNTYKLAVRTAKYKYIYTTHFETSNFHQFQKCDEVRELFDLESDPGEKNNVASQHKELTAYFDEKVSSFVARVLRDQKIDERERLRENIRALKSSGKI